MCTHSSYEPTIFNTINELKENVNTTDYSSYIHTYVHENMFILTNKHEDIYSDIANKTKKSIKRELRNSSSIYIHTSIRNFGIL